MTTILEALKTKNAGWEKDEYWSCSAQYEDAFSDDEVILWENVGSYQGDYFVLLKSKTGEYGFIVIGYGSCSGCDALEDVKGYGTDGVEEREKKLKEVADHLESVRSGVHWEPTKERMREYLTNECDREMKETYISDEGEKKVMWPKLIKAVS